MNSESHQFQPELYRGYISIMARYGLRKSNHLRQKLDSSDIVQEAMLQAHVALPQFRGSTEDEFVAWLREILENKMRDALKHFRRKKRDLDLERRLCETLQESSVRIQKMGVVVAAQHTSPLQHVVRSEKLRVLTEVLDALPESQRTALELHHLQGHSLADTARLMDRTTISVAGLLRRGLAGMREQLKDREHELR